MIGAATAAANRIRAKRKVRHPIIVTTQFGGAPKLVVETSVPTKVQPAPYVAPQYELPTGGREGNAQMLQVGTEQTVLQTQTNTVAADVLSEGTGRTTVVTGKPETDEKLLNIVRSPDGRSSRTEEFDTEKAKEVAKELAASKGWMTWLRKLLWR